MGQSMIERVAKAIEDSGSMSSYLTYEHLREARARAAIEAMREPTMEMEIVGTEAWLCEAAMEDRARTNYVAMINEALEERA